MKDLNILYAPSDLSMFCEAFKEISQVNIQFYSNNMQRPVVLTQSRHTWADTKYSDFYEESLDLFEIRLIFFLTVSFGCKKWGSRRLWGHLKQSHSRLERAVHVQPAVPAAPETHRSMADGAHTNWHKADSPVTHAFVCVHMHVRVWVRIRDGGHSRFPVS